MDFSKGIYTKVFEYTDNDGITQKLLLKPLKGDDLSNLFKVMSELQKISNADNTLDSGKVLTLMSSETGGLLHNMCVKTLHNSYPETSLDEVEMFVTCHLMSLFPVIIEINMPRK